MKYRYHMNPSTGYGVREGSMVLYNNKLYGVAQISTNGKGVLFEFDPLSNAYTVKHEFRRRPQEQTPRPDQLVYNNKLYGTTMYGGKYQQWCVVMNMILQQTITQ